ncbi:MAG: hypothetical protein AB7F78_17885, partial [Hyphomicrobiaceae bacterium]
MPSAASQQSRKAADHYDLFVPRQGWKADTALVMSPYVEYNFFRTFFERLRPKRLHVVVDDGCRVEDLDVIRKAVTAGGLKDARRLHIAVGAALGLVHAKIFYIVWKTPGGQRAQSLVFGSANATRQGFSGTVNAELISDTRLSKLQHAEAVNWCDQVLEATRSKSMVRISASGKIKLADGMNLRLPALRVAPSIRKSGNLDHFLQRGRLLSPYRPDPSFLSVPINLKEALPRGVLEDAAAAAGFTTKETKRLKFPYISAHTERSPALGEAADREEDADVGNWRSKYFVWTHLGDWCSEPCFKAHGAEFRKRGADEREAALEQLSALTDHSQRKDLRDRYHAALDRLCRIFEGDMEKYLHATSGVLDRKHYDRLFDERIDRDLDLANDEVFRIRFTFGYELVQVPRFRQDVAGWRGFVNSFARQLCLSHLRGRSQSLMLKSLVDVLQEIGQSND